MARKNLSCRIHSADVPPQLNAPNRQSQIAAFLGRCPSTVLRVALGRALIYEGNETVLGTNPNRTHDQPKPYLETAETVLDLYADKGMFPFLLCGAHKKNSLKIDAFPFSNY